MAMFTGTLTSHSGMWREIVVDALVGAAFGLAFASYGSSVRQGKRLDALLRLMRESEP